MTVERERNTLDLVVVVKLPGYRFVTFQKLPHDWQARLNNRGLKTDLSFVKLQERIGDLFARAPARSHFFRSLAMTLTAS